MESVLKKNLFNGRQEALQHVNHLHLWPIAQVLEEESEEIHWHRWDTHIYVISGGFISIDTDLNQEVRLEAGDYMMMPKNKLHAMKAAKGSIVIYATQDPINFAEPVNLHPDDLVI